MSNRSDPTTNRLFLLGAGFSRPAGLPVAADLRELVCDVAAMHFQVDDYSHLEDAFKRYEAYLDDTAPGTPFDLETFGAWLDWEHTLRLKGSDTFSEHGNQAGLQLRWAIAKVLHDATPATTPQLYTDFASQLTTSDRVLTLNYDRLLEQALEEVGLPYRRFPGRYSEVSEHSAVGANGPPELILCKLHGSIDWVYAADLDHFDPGLRVSSLTEGPRMPGDGLTQIGVIDPRDLDAYFANGQTWSRLPPVLMPPSTAKPLASSPLVPLWDGAGLYSYMLGGFTVIGCSLPHGDPYVLQLVHHVATDYVAGRVRGGRIWPQRRMKVVDYQTTPDGRDAFCARYRFMDGDHTNFDFDGLDASTLGRIFEEPDLFPEERDTRLDVTDEPEPGPDGL